MSVGRICTREVMTADPDESVEEAAIRMRHRSVGTLLVLNGHQQPIGIVTDRDLVVRVIALGKNPKTTPLGEVMTAHPERIPEDMSIETALSLMRSRGLRRYPVVDAHGKLVGLVTLDDILELIGEELHHVSQIIERQKPRRLELV